MTSNGGKAPIGRYLDRVGKVRRQMEQAIQGGRGSNDKRKGGK